MKLEWNRKYTTIAVYAFLVCAASIMLYLALSNLGAVRRALDTLLAPVLPILYGVVVAYLLNPVMESIERRLEKLAFYQKLKKSRRRAISLLLTYIITITVLVLMLLIVLPQVAANTVTLYGQIQSYVASAEESISSLLEMIPPDLLAQEYVERLTRLAGEGIQRLINWMAASTPKAIGMLWQLGSGVITAFVALIVSVYVLLAKERFMAQIRKVMFAFFPAKGVKRAAHIVHTADKMFGGFITGKIIDSIIIGILCFVGLMVMGMPNAVLVSFIVGVTNVLPYFGPFVGAVPGFILIAIVSPVQGLIFLVFILVLQQIDGNIIGPMILGDSIGLSAFWVVFSILFFGGVFGFLGMFIGVPTFGVIYALIRETVLERLAERNMPTSTAEYLSPIDSGEQ